MRGDVIVRPRKCCEVAVQQTLFDDAIPGGIGAERSKEK
jgi:hypothetical protein